MSAAAGRGSSTCRGARRIRSPWCFVQGVEHHFQVFLAVRRRVCSRGRFQGVETISKFFLAVRRRVCWYGGHATTITPPVSGRDLPPHGPRQRLVGVHPGGRDLVPSFSCRPSASLYEAWRASRGSDAFPIFSCRPSRGSDLVPSFFLPSVGEFVGMEGMPRRLRLQYPDAIYHLMARGNGRHDIICDDVDRDRLQEHLGRAAIRCSWRVYTFAIMPNHLHVVLKMRSPATRREHLSSRVEAVPGNFVVLTPYRARARAAVIVFSTPFYLSTEQFSSSLRGPSQSVRTWNVMTTRQS